MKITDKMTVELIQAAQEALDTHMPVEITLTSARSKKSRKVTISPDEAPAPASPDGEARTFTADVREVLADAYHPEGVEIWLDSSSDPRDETLLPQRELIVEGMGAEVLARAELSVGRTLGEIREQAGGGS